MTKHAKFRFLSPIHRATRQVQLYLEPHFLSERLSFNDAHVLSFVCNYPSPIRELFRVFGFKLSTLTSMLDRLEERGLIERHTDPDDRRSFIVRPTSEAHKIVRRISPKVRAFERTVRARVTEGDLEGFNRVLQAIAEVTQVRVRDGSGKDDSALRKEV